MNLKKSPHIKLYTAVFALSNASVDPANIVTLRKGLREGQVREGQF